jgi:hypothetical protein
MSGGKRTDELFFAVQQGRADNIPMLISGSIDIDVMYGGKTLLCIAAKFGHVDVFRALLLADADANLGTPIVTAAEQGHTRIVETLLDHGVDIEQKNLDGQTPLLVAARNGRVATCRLLLDRGANVNCCCPMSLSPLHAALYVTHGQGEFEIVQLLIQHGANLEHKMGCDTPLLRAADYGEENIIKLLVDNGANVNCRDEQATALHYIAAHIFSSEQVAFMIRKGANIYCLNVHGYLPMSVAATDSVWPILHRQISDIAMALAPLALPAYHLLWIIDWLPRAALVTEYRKVGLINGLIGSINKIRAGKKTD